LGLKFGSTFGHLQVGLASRVYLHVSRINQTNAKSFDRKAAIASLKNLFGARNEQFAIA
jgi:hypothetical protein